MGLETRCVSIILPIWVGNQFRSVIARLIGGDAELLVGLGIITKLRRKVGFGKRFSHIAHGEWEVMTRNGRG